MESVGPRANDSKSLWNFTSAPGWSLEEVQVFRLCLMKFGLGRWAAIVESGALPGKTVGQMNNQMQRMIGQQSTNEFQGLHVDLQKVFEVNKLKEGARKNGCLINTGENPTREKIKRKREENLARFGLGEDAIEEIVIPMPKASDVLTDEVRREKLAKLAALQHELLVLEQDLLEDDLQLPAPAKKKAKR